MQLIGEWLYNEILDDFSTSLGLIYLKYKLGKSSKDLFCFRKIELVIV